MGKLVPFISEKFDGVIWRMETDVLTDTVFIESRNAEDHLVTFSAIDLNNGSVKYKNIAVDEKWLTGIDIAYKGILLLHGFQNENSPVHKGLVAIDDNGKVLWSNYTYAFDYLSDQGPVVYNTQLQPKKPFIIDVFTGDNIQIASGFGSELDKQVTYPDSAFENLNIQLPVKAVSNSTYYLRHGSFIIVSLHAVSNSGFNQYLFVLQNNAVVFEDILNSNIQKQQPEAFILYKNCLLYIKNKSELKVLNL